MCAMYCVTALQIRTTLTSDVNGRRCDNSQTECDGDQGGSTGPPRCQGPVCLPDTQCAHYSALIQSPNYPKSYPPNQDVYWFLKLTKDVRVDVPREQRHVRILELTVSSVMLKWSPSTIKPTGTITYKVYYGLHGNQSTLAGFHLVTGRWYYNLTGLSSSTSYFVYVVEVMDCGREDVGHMVNFTTRSSNPVMSLPDPVDLKVLEVDPGTVFVSWTTASPFTGPLSGYRSWLGTVNCKMKITFGLWAAACVQKDLGIGASESGRKRDS
ncbi:uncharacterized protein LOC122562950 [Chiloscyllium plagiosum]|uniref:uncharacterized protein LOC122562950 n=1 Tax=Chiloscyllium plagiosum TaxID=36176 RepID=UPI001CB83EA5|nr:uncharacterized protein LOC122562950 [Chiloscyllium plagiosum]